MVGLTTIRKLAASLVVIAAFALLFGRAPFLRARSEDPAPRVVSGLTPVEPWAPVETILAGMPLESSSRPVADCVAESAAIAREAACEGCMPLQLDAEAAPGAFLWLEPRPAFEREPWRLRAELLHCSGGGSGRRFSYATAPGYEPDERIPRPVPLVAGGTEILRVGHPGWSFTIDEVPGPEAIRTVELGLRLEDWRPYPAAGDARPPDNAIVLARGNEVCIVATEYLDGESYLMTLVQRQT